MPAVLRHFWVVILMIGFVRNARVVAKIVLDSAPVGSHKTWLPAQVLK
jgi:hypothetical protein